MGRDMAMILISDFPAWRLRSVMINLADNCNRTVLWFAVVRGRVGPVKELVAKEK